MGVDFYACENCGETFCDAGYYFRCECGSRFCSDVCGDKKLIQAESEDEVCDDEYLDEISSCIFCRVEQVCDADMVRFLLKKLGLTHEHAVDIFREETKD